MPVSRILKKGQEVVHAAKLEKLDLAHLRVGDGQATRASSQLHKVRPDLQAQLREQVRLAVLCHPPKPLHRQQETVTLGKMLYPCATIGSMHVFEASPEMMFSVRQCLHVSPFAKGIWCARKVSDS